MPIVGVWSVPATAFDAPDRVGQLGVARTAAVPRTLRLPDTATAWLAAAQGSSLQLVD